MTELVWQRVWPAPAKINLFLHVVGRRPDGYHLLQTAFRFLDIVDELRFSPRADREIVRANDIAGVPAGQDLVIRAAELLRRHTGRTEGVTIELKKTIPMGGGLGGGSSDAATTLIALNALWQTGLNRAELQALGVQLGADVPIFIHGHTAFAEGIGDRFVDISVPACWYLLVVPAVTVPTADIFRSEHLCRDTPEIAPSAWYPGFGHNDLEAVTCQRYPVVGETLQRLAALGPARMSGSGACCFAEFASRKQAIDAQRKLPAELHSHICAGVDFHPLHASKMNPIARGV